MEKSSALSVQSQSGFSVAGALVALTITAIGSAALVSLFESSTRGAPYVESKMELSSLVGSLGVMLADQKLCTQGLEFEVPGPNATPADRSNHWFSQIGLSRTGRKLTGIKANGSSLVVPNQRMGSARISSIEVVTNPQNRTAVAVTEPQDSTAWSMVATLEVNLNRESGAPTRAPKNGSVHEPTNQQLGTDSPMPRPRSFLIHDQTS